MPTIAPSYTPNPFQHVLPIEDRIITFEHDIFLPFCSDASDDLSDSGTSSTAAED